MEFFGGCFLLGVVGVLFVVVGVVSVFLFIFVCLFVCFCFVL